MLKRLELTGFKSFGQKTVLDFPKGITVIVGPNGSGKSNIIDALRWLLGEREAKNLRGAKAEDLIFSGTNKKARLGMAQAAVYFDNSAKAIPVDFNDVAVSRKIYRDGTSEYQINKSAVRLKDVVDLFAQSKMGTKGFSIVNQGNSDAFIKASPQERREMMEEALGLRQYQLKKHDAELKLKGTQTNLEKANTTLEELLPRLRLLRRQTGKWEKRAEFAAELADLENQYFTSKIQDLKKSVQSIDPKIQDIDRQLGGKRKELSDLESGIRKIESSKPAQLSVSPLNDQRFKLQRQLGGLETQLKLVSAPQKASANVGYDQLLTLVKVIQKELRMLCDHNDLNHVHNSLKTLKEKIDQLFNTGEVKKDDSEKAGITDQIAAIQKELTAIEERERQNLRQFEDFNNNFRAAFEALAQKREEIQRLQATKSQLLLEKDRWNYQWQDLEDKLRQAGRQANEFGDVQLAANRFDYLTGEARMFKLRNELALIGEVDQELVKEATEVEERHKFLDGQTKDLIKASADLNGLIGELGQKIHHDFGHDLKLVNEEFDKYFKTMFGEGKARLVSRTIIGHSEAEPKNLEEIGGVVDIEVNIPSKGVKSLESLSGGEKSLVAIAALFALIAVSPPPFLVFDEVDAALDEKNSRRFAELLKNFSQKTQFAIVTHNRAVMEVGDVLYGVTMGKDGISKVLSLKLG